MVTLRERKTHFGMIVNLPLDHPAASVNAAIIAAFATLPTHLKRTLTWDQGVEMADTPSERFNIERDTREVDPR